ncbi:hypothetical protein [Arachidicoccus sp.]|uniref:hypothetical protein n=1 Tax=Arachidicoccus sp. TaxID=1872624 RepID=UPI003D244C28
MKFKDGFLPEIGANIEELRAAIKHYEDMLFSNSESATARYYGGTCKYRLGIKTGNEKLIDAGNEEIYSAALYFQKDAVRYSALWSKLSNPAFAPTHS